MGKGGKGSGNRVARAPADDDEALLNAAIAENKAAQAKAEQEKAKQEKLKAETAAAAPPGKALTKQQIIEALNAVPTFCLLNGEANIVGLQDPENPKYEVCFWMTDAAEAKEMLTAAKANNSEEVAGKLHLGVTPLGVAFGLASGWIETSFYGDMRLRGAQEDTADLIPMLRQQVEAQGLAQASWQVPVFCCDELQQPEVMPMFLSRKALQETWVVSGRKLSELPAQQAVMDLRVLVEQMQTDKFAWNTLHFLTARNSVKLVKEAREQAGLSRGVWSGKASTGAAKAAPEADPPPPLEGDDGPPPLV